MTELDRKAAYNGATTDDAAPREACLPESLRTRLAQTGEAS